LFLFALPDKPTSFAAVYVFCGATDVADGYLARRFKVASDFGAKLDSLADFIFTIAIVAALFFFTDVIENVFVLTSIGVIVGIRIINLFVARLKFHQWGVLHTTLSKMTGLLCFVAVPICIAIHAFPEFVVLPIAAIGLLAALEESLIIYRCSDYTVDVRSYRQARKELL
jgi:CDP-diacylglycerol--glycerol-3-phosphate 3-phosphatidyltransferase